MHQDIEMSRYLIIMLIAAALGVAAAAAQSAGAASKSSAQRSAQTSKPAKAKAPAKQAARNVPKAASGSKKKTTGKAAASRASGSGGAREPERLPAVVPGGASAAGSGTPASGDIAVPIAPSRPAKPIMNRMYALDGDTFYHNGKKIRVRGLEAVHDSDVAKQRLQRALDSGEVAIEPIGTRETGEVEAAVRVNGRDLAEMLRPEVPDVMPTAEPTTEKSAGKAAEQAAEPPAPPAQPAPEDGARR